MEWNDLPFGETVFGNTYQTMPETRWNYWNLILFNEHEREDGTLMWLMRKNQCMHCADPGCLKACPSDGAIVQYTNGIVDFQQDNCIGCGYCITGCPFNIPKFNPETKRVYQMHSLHRPRQRRPRARLHQVLPHRLPALRQQGRHERTRRNAAPSNFAITPTSRNAGVYDPPGVGGTGVMYVLHDATQPELYGGLPKDPSIPWTVKLWKGPLKWLGNVAMIGGLIGLFVHYLRFGPKSREPEDLEPLQPKAGPQP